MTPLSPEGRGFRPQPRTTTAAQTCRNRRFNRPFSSPLILAVDAVDTSRPFAVVARVSRWGSPRSYSAVGPLCLGDQSGRRHLEGVRDPHQVAEAHVALAPLDGPRVGPVDLWPKLARAVLIARPRPSCSSRESMRAFQSWSEACRSRRSRRTLDDDHRPDYATRTRSKFASFWPGSG